MHSNDLDLTGTLEELLETYKCLEKTLVIKDLNKATYCLDLHVEYF